MISVEDCDCSLGVTLSERGVECVCVCVSMQTYFFGSWCGCVFACICEYVKECRPRYTFEGINCTVFLYTSQAPFNLIKCSPCRNVSRLETNPIYTGTCAKSVFFSIFKWFILLLYKTLSSYIASWKPIELRPTIYLQAIYLQLIPKNTSTCIAKT